MYINTRAFFAILSCILKMFIVRHLLLLFTSAFSNGILQSDNLRNDPLILTPLIEKDAINDARNISAVPSNLFDGVKSHSGFITVNKTSKWNLFFWYFPAENADLETTPWIVWLQGGPGVSSLYGLFNEIGPLKIVNGTVHKMPVTWASNYSLLFIDNPVGVGFSYSEIGGYVTNEDTIGECLLNFIQQFLQMFPELRKAPLFIAGESYAGKYVPTFGHYIHNNKNDSHPINLKGLAIGSGWIDPPSMLHYSEWAFQVGLIDPDQANDIRNHEDKARKYWKEGDIPAYSQEADTVYYILRDYAPVNSYNYLKDESDVNKDYIDVLNGDEIRKALHVGSRHIVHMNQDVFLSLWNETHLSVKPWLEELLEHYGVICFNGQLDMRVAYALSVNTYRNLKWSGANEYLKAQRIPVHDRKNESRVIGFIKASGNFMEVMVRGAGHMVPGDKPHDTKQIIDTFIEQFKDN